MSALGGAEERLRAKLSAGGEDGADDHPRAWNPRRGDDADTLLGELVSVATVPTKYGDADVATVKDAEGTSWAVWLTSRTIQSEWTREAPKTGEVVAVQFVGERTTQDGQRQYPVFRVAVDRPGEGDSAQERWGETAPW